MRRQFVSSVAGLGVAIGVLLLHPALAAGQAKSSASQSDKVSRTADGHPDLTGLWGYETVTPLERPAELAGKQVLTAQEAAEFEKRVLEGRNHDRRDGGTQADVARAYNEFWWDQGTKVIGSRRTSLVIDPPDGRIPPLTPQAQKRANTPEAQKKLEVRRGRLPASSWADMDTGDRCIVRAVPRFPGAYNNNFLIAHNPGTVVLVSEMIHEARIIPLDGRPHIDQKVQQWMGDSRGRWEGDTLVVDTTNFTDRQDFRDMPQGGMHLVERFTRVNADAIEYQVTIDAPETYTKPWTVAFPLTRNQGQMFEYACHEGNYGMSGLLSGSRAQEKAEEARKGSK